MAFASRMLVGAAFAAVFSLPAVAQPASSLVAPPRTILDITAILDQQKPDPGIIAKRRAEAEAQPPENASPTDLVDFYWRRGIAADLIGRLVQKRDDEAEAVRIGRDANVEILRPLQELALAEMRLGNSKQAFALHLQRIQEAKARNRQVDATIAYAHLVQASVNAGDLQKAREYLGEAERSLGLLTNFRDWPIVGDAWRGQVMRAQGSLAEAEGRYGEAEKYFRDALAMSDRMVEKAPMVARLGMAHPSIFEQAREFALYDLAENLMKQRRLVEGEVEARRALLSQLKRRGKYSVDTAIGIGRLGRILLIQGRSAEAQRLFEAAIEVFRETANENNSPNIVVAMRGVATALSNQGKWDAAMAEWDAIRANLVGDPSAIERFVTSQQNYGMALIRSHRGNEAVPVFERALEKSVATVGDKHYETAELRGQLATALLHSRQNSRAVEVYKAALPILLSPSRQSDGDEVDATRDQRLTFILEGYMGLLAEVRGTPLERQTGVDAANEAFRLADAARGRAVQRALSASSARAAARDPALAELVRQEQDAQKQIAAQFGLLSNTLAAPPEQQDATAIKALRTQIDTLRTARAKAREQIEKKFPDYVNLIDPRPATIEQAKKSLRPGEALIATYVGRDQTFVWAVPYEGAPAFAATPLGEAKIGAMVADLRKALDPNATTLGEIPAYNVALAGELYDALLRPVEPGWAGANSIMAVQHKALGQFPLGLLVTAATPPGADGDVMFSGYRSVAFLARKAAITQVPSVAALATLRNLPPAPANREALVAFGDPFFSTAQAKESVAPVRVAALQTRGRPLVRRSAPATESVNSAELAMLPRLPDTADEVRNIALALHANLDRDVFLGARANEKQVKTMDLSNRRVVMFATHGLVPGDLNGLAQPALALSAPEVADIDGDGLLTLEEILGLRLNADWVVLSACNTASGDGAGAEAVSGLGRAFFYAGTRALLVSNWPVETTAARLLTTDLFRRQAEDAKLGRGEAMRQAMVALIDGPGYQEDGKPVFSYAHPIFWAPFTVVGDGG